MSAEVTVRVTIRRDSEEDVDVTLRYEQLSGFTPEYVESLAKRAAEKALAGAKA